MHSYNDPSSDWTSVIKWVKLLISLAEHGKTGRFPHECHLPPLFLAKLEVNAENVLKTVANQIREDIQGEPGSDETREDVEYLHESKVPAHLRQLLSPIDQEGRIVWVELVAIFIKHCEWRFSSLQNGQNTHIVHAVPPEAGGVIAQMAIHDTDDRVQLACFEALLPLIIQEGN
jgi:hypothetical protein